MKTVNILVAATLLAAAWPAQAMELLRSEKFDLDIVGRGQLIASAENVPDPSRDNNRLYMFLKQARLGFNGRFDDLFTFETQFAYGGENANGSNTDLGMLDFVADVPVRPLGDDAVFKFGQFRVPYGREGITDRGYMNFGERSIANMAAYQGRDYGMALQKKHGSWIATLGVFSAGGRDVPQRYLPETLGFPEIVARFGYNDGVDRDIYHVVGTDLDLARTTKALYVNALYMQDTLIGHNTVLNLRTIDKNLLIDSNYNQYIGAGPNGAVGNGNTLKRGNIWFMGADAVVRHPLSATRAVEAEAQVDWGGYENHYGGLHIGSYRLQGGFRADRWHFGARYAGLMMDRGAGKLTGGRVFSPAMGSVVHEITPAITWHKKKHNLKFTADLPIYLNMPVFYEKGIGAYVFADQPGQVTYIGTGGNTNRRSIVEARMLAQFMF